MILGLIVDPLIPTDVVDKVITKIFEQYKIDSTDLTLVHHYPTESWIQLYGNTLELDLVRYINTRFAHKISFFKPLSSSTVTIENIIDYMKSEIKAGHKAIVIGIIKEDTPDSTKLLIKKCINKDVTTYEVTVNEDEIKINTNTEMTLYE